MEEEKKIITHYIKNNDFKTIFSTGMYGGITINGLINVNFCVDRTAIPTKTESAVDLNTNTLKEEKKESRDGIVKEVQIGVLMDVNMAKHTVAWLQQQIKQLEDLQKNQLSK